VALPFSGWLTSPSPLHLNPQVAPVPMTLGLLLLFLGPFPPAPEAPVSDTFGDPDVRALVEAAREARGRAEEGLESFDGRMWERIYVGFDAVGFRRERGLFSQERVARIRWEREGERTVRWEAARREVPVAGLSSDDSESMAQSLVRSLARESPPPPLLFEPGSDRLTFGSGEWALHPLADTAGLHYRYASGDTLRIVLPEGGRTLTLAEVRVEPRRAEFRLLTASLWFDLASGALVRSVYRPSRPFDLALDDPEGASEVPRLLRPIRAEIRLVSVDHSLQDFRWWIPRRFSFEGEGQVGRLARFPVTMEWTVSEVLVNRDPPGDLVPDPLPEGWTLRRSDRAEAEGEEGGGEDPESMDETEEVEGERLDVGGGGADEGDQSALMDPVLVVVVPTGEELATGPGLTRGVRQAPGAFRPEELRELEASVRQLFPPVVTLRPSLQWGLEGGLTRFNRVEGLASGVAARMDLPGGREFRGEIRAGVSALLPTGELAVRSGVPRDRSTLAVYRRLVGSSEWEDPHTITSSLSSLVLGEGPAPLHRAWGGEVIWDRQVGRMTRRARFFAERHDVAEIGTDFHLLGVFSDRPRAPVAPADPGSFLGLVLDHRWHSEVDPRRPRFFAGSHLEGGTGTVDYLRVRANGGMTLPLGDGWGTALEMGGGWGSPRLPFQRRFFPGGPEGYRGGRVGERTGRSFWLVRGEVGRGVPGARMVVFGDMLRLDPFGTGDASPVDVAAGMGISLLDGLVRLEAGRRVSGAGGWRLHAYLDGLF
jgi:hypothetical protein